MNTHDLYHQIFKIWRAKRHQWFLSRIKPRKDEVMLDIGGTAATWLQHGQPVKKIICLNLSDRHPELPQEFSIDFVVGDACELPYADKQFDLVYSNSVIEHVGNFDRQERFAAEARRVGGALWIQTPAQECPFEPHYLAPFVHWLPVSIRRRVLRWVTPWGWIAKPDQETIDHTMLYTQLLNRRQFTELFPDCEIIVERMLWVIPKSYIAIRPR